jgi:hypothetical protein
MRTIASNAADRRVVDDRRNEACHALLREAAEKRDERQRVHSFEDAAAAKLESHDLLSLALAQARASAAT